MVAFRILLLSVIISFSALTSQASGFFDRQKETIPADDKVYTIADLDECPAVILQVAPVYPAELKKEGIVGQSIVVFTVNSDGSVTDAKVKDSTHAEFGVAALECIQQWRFKPGLVSGNPVKFRMGVPIMFNID